MWQFNRNETFQQNFPLKKKKKPLQLNKTIKSITTINPLYLKSIRFDMHYDLYHTYIDSDISLSCY